MNAVATKKQKYTNIHLCHDCMIAESNGDYSGMSDSRAAEVSSGFDRLTKRGHLSANFDPDTEEGVRDLTSSPCDVCGTRLAGSRYRFALWPKTKQVVRVGKHCFKV